MQDVTISVLNTGDYGLEGDTLNVVDYNGDGINDVVWTRGSTGKSMLYTNDGTGTFTESTLTDVDTPIKEVFSVEMY